MAIVFIDLVGFTALSRRLGAKHLVEMLDDLFSGFDAEIGSRSMERIKTIGDAYMAVSGLTNSDGPAMALDAADFALASRKIVSDYADQSGLPIAARIGLHVGPVVAGVIGRRKPAFDCWGEAVNLASRLEHAASPGCIMISEAAYWRLKDRFELAVFDDLDLKGIGPTTAYLLNGRLA